MKKTVTLSYNGISKDYPLGNQKRSGEKYIEFLKGVFAEKYVIRQWYNSGKLNTVNFAPSNPGTIGRLLEDSLSEKDRELYYDEIKNVKSSVQVVYNREI